MIARMLADVTSTVLPPGITLGSIPLHRRLTELEFSLSAGDVSATHLSRLVEHGYHLQHLIYSLALDRYLAHRLAGYDYDAHFGGGFYLFIRGVRPEWKQANGTPAGVFQHRPARATLEQLDRLLHSARKQPA